MARQIIVYSATRQPSGDLNFAYAFWLAVPATLQAQTKQQTTAYVSVVPAVALQPTWGVTTAEAASLQSGATLEVVRTSQASAGETQAQVGARLLAEYTAAQAALNSQAPAKLWVGVYYDPAAGNWNNVPA